MESQNIFVGLCIDEFNPFRSFAAPYFCWPMILTVYNLPLMMCMRPEFIFLYMVIPSLNNPSRNIDVCLRPLIEELNQLWSSRTLTFDVLRKHDFQMKVALIWIINDFHVHKMVFGWRKHEKLTCLYCMENTKSLHLNKWW